MVQSFGSIAKALPFACTLMLAIPAGSTASASRAGPTRYFEVQVNGSGQLNSSLYALNSPCGGCDQLTAHDLSWSWVAYELVVYSEHGPHHRPELHRIGAEPRVGALFEESTLYSKSNGCTTNFSTSGSFNFSSRLLAGALKLSYDGPFLNVDAGPPFDRHFSLCGRGTASTHGQGDTLASWDGLNGPWNYVAVRSPTRNQLRHGKAFGVSGYQKSLQETHGTPRHMSEGSSSLSMGFKSLPGGMTNVFNAERRFKKQHPVSSRGFVEF